MTLYIPNKTKVYALNELLHELETTLCPRLACAQRLFYHMYLKIALFPRIELLHVPAIAMCSKILVPEDCKVIENCIITCVDDCICPILHCAPIACA